MVVERLARAVVGVVVVVFAAVDNRHNLCSLVLLRIGVGVLESINRLNRLIGGSKCPKGLYVQEVLWFAFALLESFWTLLVALLTGGW